MNLTEEQIKDLIENIEKKLVLDRGISCKNLSPTRVKDKRFEASSDMVPGTDLGNFKHIIKEYQVDVTIWLTEEKNPIEFMASPHFSYWHHCGGSNGHYLNFRIWGRVGDVWTKFQIKVLHQD